MTAPRVPAGARSGWRASRRGRRRATDFYRIDTSIVAAGDRARRTGRLRIHGMVDREITLTYADLLDRQRTEDWMTLNCVSNPVGGT